MKKGFTLLETLVAIAILIATILGPLTLASSSIRAASTSKNQIVAFNLAQEGIEFVRNKRDTNLINGGNWLFGLEDCEELTGCYIDVTQDSSNDIRACISTCPVLKRDSITGLFNYQNGLETSFLRKVTVNSLSVDEAKVTVEISWNERTSSRDFTLETYLFKWR